mmetsp:Transcript_16449/g.20098  ORF Transcript_16449/g.20098 Transcript_16449/m.20098 type:complete len:441 (-) Transcript_16449:569-1891(-)
MNIPSDQLIYVLALIAPPSLSLLYILVLQVFLAAWHECKWTHLAKSITIRLTIVIIAVAIVLALQNHQNHENKIETMTHYLIPILVLTISSIFTIYSTRKYYIQGPKPKHKDMNGKVVLITGANAGIGKETAKQLLEMGATVIMACRSEARAKEAMKDILKSIRNTSINSTNDSTSSNTGLLDNSLKSAKERLLFLQCDVSNFKSVHKAVTTFNEMDLPLHVLINNAGIMMGQRKTTQGVGSTKLELTMTCNHLGHFLLTHLLLPKLNSTENGRLIIVTSSTYILAANGIDLQDLNCEKRNYTMFSQYAQSKLANILMGKELVRQQNQGFESNVKDSKKLYPISVYMVHPGLVRTDVVRNMPWYLRYPNMIFSFVLVILQKTPEAGAYTNVYCATSDDAQQYNGEYLSNSQVFKTNEFANDVEAGKELWRLSEQMVGIKK